MRRLEGGERERHLREGTYAIPLDLGKRKDNPKGAPLAQRPISFCLFA